MTLSRGSGGACLTAAQIAERIGARRTSVLRAAHRLADLDLLVAWEPRPRAEWIFTLSNGTYARPLGPIAIALVEDLQKRREAQGLARFEEGE